MDREQKTITTPKGHTVVLNAYLTGREANEVKAVMTAGIKINMDDAASGSMNVADLPASLVDDQNQKALQLLLVSIDGKTENVYELVLDLPESEYDFIEKAAKDIRTPLAEEK